MICLFVWLFCLFRCFFYCDACTWFLADDCLYMTVCTWLFVHGCLNMVICRLCAFFSSSDCVNVCLLACLLAHHFLVVSIQTWVIFIFFYTLLFWINLHYVLGVTHLAVTKANMSMANVTVMGCYWKLTAIVTKAGGCGTNNTDTAWGRLPMEIPTRVLLWRVGQKFVLVVICFAVVDFVMVLLLLLLLL